MHVHRILRAARIISWSTRFLSLAVGLVTIRLIIGQIGAAQYGQVAFGLAFLTGISGVDLGLTQAMTRFVSRLSREPEGTSAGTFWAALAVLLMALFVLQMAILGVIAVFYSWLPDLHSYGRGVLFAMGTLTVLGTLFSASSSLFAGFQLYGYSGIGKLLRPALYLVAIVWLWQSMALSVERALWVSVIATLIANAIMFACLIAKVGGRMRWDWAGFPRQHSSTLREILIYALKGWQFSLATILLSSGAVLAVGFLQSPSEVAHLQIALVLLNGITASLTGGMTPLTTIASASADGDPVARERIGTAALSLLRETTLLVAAVIVGFVNFGKTVVTMMIGNPQANGASIEATFALALVMILLALGTLPFFTFRYALVEAKENADYSRLVLWSSAAGLLLGVVGCALTGSQLFVVAGIGVAFVYRAIKAYAMARRHLSGVSTAMIVAMMLKAGIVLEVVALAAKALGRFGVPPVTQMILFGAVAALGYLLRTRFPRKRKA